MLLALCLMPANNTAQILNSLKDIIRPTDPSLIRTLNGQWDFYFINGADWKEQACFYQPDYDISSWDRILVPGCWDALGYVEPKYANPEEINGLYRKNFTVPKGWKDKHVFVILENFCYCLIQKTLGELPDFEVMTWQLCNLLRSTLNCLQGTLILLQRYEFYLYIKSTVLFIMSLR